MDTNCREVKVCLNTSEDGSSNHTFIIEAVLERLMQYYWASGVYAI